MEGELQLMVVTMAVHMVAVTVHTVMDTVMDGDTMGGVAMDTMGVASDIDADMDMATAMDIDAMDTVHTATTVMMETTGITITITTIITETI